jgi:glycosyltransferase involved in cell wall biosynthesis
VRVLFVTHSFPRFRGDGPGNFILRLARALQGRAVDVAVIAPHAPNLAEEEILDGVAVTRVRYAPDARETLAYTGTMAAQVATSWQSKVDLFSLLRALRRAVHAERHSVDLVHAHWWFPSGLAASKQRTALPPLVTTLHGSDVRFAQGVLRRALMRRVMRASARVTAVSQWLALEAAELGAATPIVAPMPVETDLFVPRDDARSGILFVGKLDRQKGVHVLLDALNLLPPTVHANIVGDGPDAATLRKQSDRLGLGDRVRWHGYVAHDALPDYYNRAQLLVACATEPEGLGLSAVEALLCETPVVASAVGGLPDVIEDRANGRLVRANNPSALADAIADALANHDRRAAWGREGRTRMLARFSPAVCAGTYRALYEEVAGGAHS